AADGQGTAARVVLATRLKLLMALGYLPEIDSCVQCGCDEVLSGFRPSLGGMVCPDCFAEEHHDCFSISAGGLNALRRLLDQP
uniref:DNA repair protein RecO C-terminal domain-containing protein n=1 Tax=Salmonella enterica TaxID=28901 RepID=UPI003296C4FE